MNPKKIVWLSSYPKSGNTWIRFQLINLLFGVQDTSENISCGIPDIHVTPSMENETFLNNTLIKTHYKFSNDMPLIDQTGAFIYIIRHPLNVMLSNLNYAFLTLTEDMDSSEKSAFKEQYIEDFITFNGDPRWVVNGIGSWLENIQSWLTLRNKIPNLVLKYEDLLDDPIAGLTDINSFLNLGKSQTELELAISRSTFDAMRSIEDKEIREEKKGFFYSDKHNLGTSKGYRFMNKGEKRQEKEVLSTTQHQSFIDVFGTAIEKLGYKI